MAATFNHTIIAAKDRGESARFFLELLELTEAPSWGPFTNVLLADGVLLQFAQPPVEIVDDDLFDRAYRRLCDGGVEHWADPRMQHPGEINHEHGGRGVYFKDPAGHGIELITRPYL
jgi:catechol 2,3-dioxygenase-like lactoylglutathione lyase family enzyme